MKKGRGNVEAKRKYPVQKSANHASLNFADDGKVEDRCVRTRERMVWECRKM